MSPRSRTNQLLYQAELLVGLPVGDDEHSPARRMAIEESALALFELALGSLLKEVTEHARLNSHDWRELLASDGPDVAELQRLRDAMQQPESWLYWLVGQLEKLHSDDGAARRAVQNPSTIAVGSQLTLAEQLLENLQAAKRDIASLRETSQEW
ncbi:MAG: hypothetical protein HRT78_01540 [Halomonas sp.]|uniref:DUF6586 family protein n=1 Tax=Vreelandella aquamarina TaxID=77097 RepID=UPI0007335A76|nr:MULTISPECIES: DUF6586 family protein [Halomonas]KTG25952.1 hypothetical protein AUR68_18950 [Idiomarina sp. H105]OAE96477.1 hypothetical protein AWR38_18975 [Idiomarina sp. WRN-38]MCD1650079.1 hypothetical protein [Halomonas axialensis]MCD2086421.1 hypothetical protein [Halomonas meridiana]MDC8441480.1 hypothetical protein [Halomonas aquamarina]